MIKQLTADELKRPCVLTADDLLSCGNLPAGTLIGQPRAETALKFGLNIKSKAYNIYVSGPPQSGKTSFVKKFAEEMALNEPTPPDLCYVYNFENPRCPSLLTFPAGMGKEFVSDMEEASAAIKADLTEILSSREFEDERTAIVNIFQEKRDTIIKKIQDDAKKQNFGVKMTGSGIYFMPIIDGSILSEEQYDALPEDEKEVISSVGDVIQEQAFEVMRDIKDYEKETRKGIDELEYNTALFCVGRHIGMLSTKYSEYNKVLKYLSDVKEDILDNLSDYSEADESGDDAIQGLAPWMTKKNTEDNHTKYKVKLLTDNSQTKGAPVIIDFKPTYSSVLGEIEYDSEYGNFTADFMKIKPGLLHKANGGYLILQAYDVLTSAHIWETLRNVIKTREIVIEPMREYLTGIAVSGVKPEPVPVDLKIILIGPRYYYDLLYDYDDDFTRFFKINAVFDYEISANGENEKMMAAFIIKHAKDNGFGEFDVTAINALIEYSSRLAERQHKLSAQFGVICEIMEQAAHGVFAVSAEQIKNIIAAREYRHNIHEEKLTEMIDDDVIMIDVDGLKKGQVNGLAVMDDGEYAFALPSRITATTYIGKAGIINIEKEAEMSGAIHDKGVEVLKGYLGQKYAQEFPLSLSCRICFEQNYNGIDGDSASSTELYTILSSLADTPINQSLAVTGSINQRGEIQPIGGVTYKIEGFFGVCKKRGLTNGQGVIIPARNVKDLTLNDEVISAVREGNFNIYAIDHIDDGIELLMNVKAGELNEKGKYPVASVHGRVYKKLKDFYKKSMAEG